MNTDFRRAESVCAWISIWEREKLLSLLGKSLGLDLYAVARE